MGDGQKSLGTRVVETLSSVKLSIFLFLALAGTSIFGTVIQQQADPGAYVESYGVVGARLFRMLGLVDMYHSWWFQLLLALLLANTLVCSLRRLPASLRSIRRDQFPPGAELEAKKGSAVWAAARLSEEATAAALARRFGAPRAHREAGAVVWFAQRNRWARLGAYVCHASLVLFFVGGLVGSRFGLKGFVQVPEGGTVDTIQLRGGGSLKLPFSIRCDEFELQSYPDGRPKDYISRLTVARDGRILQQKTIEVNAPLIQDGIFFYQSSYGKTGGGAVLRVLTRDGQLLADGLQLPEDGSAPIPGTNTVVELLASAEDLEGNGPAVQLTMLDASGAHAHAGQPFVVVQRFPAMDAQRGGEFVFQLTGLMPGAPYTGLQVARDPGVPLIWAGALLLTVGTLLAFFLSHQRVWVRVEGGRVVLAGTATRNQETFRETLSSLEEELRQATSAAAEHRAAV